MMDMLDMIGNFMKSGPGGLCSLTSKLCSSIQSNARLLPPRRARFVHSRPTLPRCLLRILSNTSSTSLYSSFPPRRSGSLSVGAIMSQEEVVVGDRDLLEMKTAAIRKAGPAKLQVIADFDGTLTRYWIDGGRGQTSHGLLQQGNVEFDEKRQALYDYYHPLEYSPSIPIEEKTKLMEQWWEKTHGLLVEGGLTFDAIQKSVAGATIGFREGVVELFELLEERGVPVLIFSAGLADIIEEVFRQKLHKSFKNVKIVSNRMAFDNNGHLVGFKGKTIHVLNKNEHALDMAAPVHDELGAPDGPNNDNTSVKNRTNVLLLGDHIGDLGMSDGLNYENRIAVGFLNNNIEASLETYREAFDVVYLNDASMLGVVELVAQLINDISTLR